MKLLKLAGLGLGIMLLFGGSVITCSRLAAQDTSTEAKRKVKSKIMPEYPAVAKQLNLIGKVRLETTVAADGHVSNVKVLGGNPVLASSAEDAVKKWRFETASKDTTEVIEIEFTGKN
jgi:TonB family protein